MQRQPIGAAGGESEPVEIDLSAPEFWSDPHPILDHARQRSRVARVAGAGALVVLSHEDVERLARDPRAAPSREPHSGPTVARTRLPSGGSEVPLQRFVERVRVATTQVVEEEVGTETRLDAMADLAARIPLRVGARLVASGESEQSVTDLLLSAHAPIEAALGLALWTLAEHPGQLEVVRGDRLLLPRAIEEALRFEPVVSHLPREATEDLWVGGNRVRAGTPLLLSVLAANRDPAVFENPNRFDVRRPSGAHFSLGAGDRFCAGAALVRAELQETVAALIRLRSAWEPDGEARWASGSGGLRRLESAPIRFRRAKSRALAGRAG